MFSLFTRIQPLFSLSLLLVCEFSCGKRSDSDAKNPEIVREYLTPSPPATYFLANEGCQASPKPSSPLALDNLNIWGWDESFKITSSVAPDSDIYSDESLASPHVTSTRYGRQFIRTCSGQNPGSLCVNSDGTHIPYDIDTRDNFLKVCDSQTSFPRESYENVALTSLLYIDRAARYFERVTQQKLLPVQIEVLPHFETLALDTPVQSNGATNIRLFITDNLAYYPQRHMIAIFPQSHSAMQQGRHRYWESSFVLAHELAHHIEEVITGSRVRRSGLNWDGPAHRFDTSSTANLSFERGNRLAQFSAVSEAFADLSAFYTNDEELAGFANLDCVGANRNITKPLFADNATVKKLDTTMLSVNGLHSLREEISCNKLNFSDPHVIGAILSHALNKIFNTAVADLAKDQQVRQKFLLNIKWRKAMSRNLNSAGLSQGRSILQDIGLAIEQSFDETQLNPSQKREICNINRELLTISRPYAFEGSCEQSRAAFN